MKTRAQVTEKRAEWFLRTRFNPLSGLTPQALSLALDAWDRGEIRRPALIFDKIERRDSVIATVAAKRYGAVGKRAWSVVAVDDSPAARRHQEALQFFYEHVTATSAVRRDVAGGAAMLFRQMAGAVGMGYVAHEILWQPSPQGLTATLRHVPTHFFEARTGALRYLEAETDYEGTPLEPGGWMVTAGPGILEASAVEFMFKSLPRKDWLGFCEKFGIPGVFAKTQAQPDSAEWDALHTAVRDFMSDFAAVGNADIQFVTPSGGTLNPMKDLVEYCDQRVMQLWRGGDLGTRAGANNAVGSEIQQTEMEILEGDDIAMVQAVLNRSLDPWVIRYALGDEWPLARLEIQTPEHFDSQQERETDRFFIEHGIPLALDDLYSRHSRRKPEPGDEITSTEMVVGGEGTRSGVGTMGESGEKVEDSKKPTAETEETEEAEETSDREEAEPLANEITDAVGRALDLLPDMLGEIGDLIGDLIAAARRDALTDEELAEVAREALLRLPDQAGGVGVEALAALLKNTIEGAARVSLEKNGGFAPQTPLPAVVTPETA